MLSSVRPPASRASSFAAPTRKPLSDAAVAILEDLRNVRQADFVFTGGKAGRPISNMATLMLLRRMGRGDLTAHGFRSTFSDWCSERTNFPAEVREMALAHSVSDKVEAAYRRGDLFQKRRQLAEAWASALPLSAPSATRTGRCGAASPTVARELLAAPADEVCAAWRETGRAHNIACQEVRVLLNEAIAASEEGSAATLPPDTSTRLDRLLGASRELRPPARCHPCASAFPGRR
jgi:hypothetical protein